MLLELGPEGGHTWPGNAGLGVGDSGWGMEVRRLTPYSEDKHGLAGQRLKGERARDGPQTVDGAKS